MNNFTPEPDAFAQDAELLICSTCGNQLSVTSPSLIKPNPDECKICLDPRQFVPETGQAWTTYKELLDAGTVNQLAPSKEDECIIRIQTEPSVAISQTPIILRTPHGIAIWDCAAFLHPSTASEILAMTSPTKPLLGIFISHPHFYGSSVTWARALGCSVYAHERDREWWLRGDDASAEEGRFVWWKGNTLEIARGLTMIRCGGHFDGSSVLHFDRTDTGNHGITASGPHRKGGVVLCSDTFGIAPNRHTVTFLWSYPNMLPLPPDAVKAIWNAVRPYSFEDIYSAWPGTEIIGDGRTRVIEGARNFVRMEGWTEEQVRFDDSF